MLIKEKVEQAFEILKEYDIDCWITFVQGERHHARSHDGLPVRRRT